VRALPSPRHGSRAPAPLVLAAMRDIGAKSVTEAASNDQIKERIEHHPPPLSLTRSKECVYGYTYRRSQHDAGKPLIGTTASGLPIA
jgi:hypothetical protein